MNLHEISEQIQILLAAAERVETQHRTDSDDLEDATGSLVHYLRSAANVATYVQDLLREEA